nr:uncharacterized protein LOC129153183 isoform X2 [Nothobranchius furzeri]
MCTFSDRMSSTCRRAGLPRIAPAVQPFPGPRLRGLCLQVLHAAVPAGSYACCCSSCWVPRLLLQFVFVFLVSSQVFLVSSQVFLVSSQVFLVSSQVFLVSSQVFLVSSQVFLVSSQAFLVSSQAFLVSSQAFLVSSVRVECSSRVKCLSFLVRPKSSPSSRNPSRGRFLAWSFVFSAHPTCSRGGRSPLGNPGASYLSSGWSGSFSSCCFTPSRSSPGSRGSWSLKGVTPPTHAIVLRGGRAGLPALLLLPFTRASADGPSKSGCAPSLTGCRVPAAELGFLASLPLFNHFLVHACGVCACRSSTRQFLLGPMPAAAVPAGSHACCCSLSLCSWCQVKCSWCRVKCSWCRVKCSWCRVKCSWCRVKCSWCRVKCSWCRVKRSWCRVKRSWCRVKRSWCRVFESSQVSEFPGPSQVKSELEKPF